MKFKGLLVLVLGGVLVAAATQAATVKVGEYVVSIERTERTTEWWQDPDLGTFGEKRRAKAGHELLIVTLAITSSGGSMKLDGFKAIASDGQEYRFFITEIENFCPGAQGKPSTAQHTFKRTLAFAVPKETAIEAVSIQGVTVALPRTTKAVKP